MSLTIVARLKPMYVCICNAITDSQIREAAEAGADDLWALQNELGVASGCGTCSENASEILSEVRAARINSEFAQPSIYRPRVA